jgi:ribosomal-protein-alanine N-acetyltransferase
VQNIAVRRDAQRTGTGRRLMDVLLDQARQAGVAAILLEVAVDNGPAQRLYDSYGFDGVGIRKGYYQPSNTDALVMRLELGT